MTTHRCDLSSGGLLGSWFCIFSRHTLLNRYTRRILRHLFLSDPVPPASSSRSSRISKGRSRSETIELLPRVPAGRIPLRRGGRQDLVGEIGEGRVRVEGRCAEASCHIAEQ